MGGADAHPPLDEFRRLARDLYIPSGDVGFWQGAFREPGIPPDTEEQPLAPTTRRHRVTW